MAATLNVKTGTRAGVVIQSDVVAATSGGDSFANDGQTYFVIANSSGGNVTVTMHIQTSPDGLTVTNKTVVVATATTAIIGPFDVGTYNDTGGLVNITYSGVSSVNVCAYKFPSA